MVVRIRFAALSALSLLVSACSSPVVHHPVPAPVYEASLKDDLGPYRFWGDRKPINFELGLTAQAKILRERFPDAVNATPETAPLSAMLAISGGGANGAFTAGLLKGWSESGKRVPFEIVTGVSTGALIAPFAFLGEEYDDLIVEVYTSSSQTSIFEWNILSGLLSGSGIVDTSPLQAQLRKYVTPEIIEAIAEQSRLGRTLFIITTNFDANRAVVWDIGLIAQTKGAAGAELIRSIMLASAAVPVVAPPVPIDVEVNGESFTELHVDGGLTYQVFAYPAQITVAEVEERTGLRFRREIYLIRNGNAEIRYSPAPTGVVSIAERTINVLLSTQSASSVKQIYNLAQRDNVKFRMIEIPPAFEADRSHEFDPMYMSDLMALGRRIGRTGDFWYDKPPSLR